MRRVGLIGAMIVVVAAVLAYGIWHQVNGPRFELRVRPRGVLSNAECRAEVQSVGYGSAPAAQWCEGAGSAASYIATLTNTGGRGAWVSTCGIDPIGRSGEGIDEFAGSAVPMWVTTPGVGARPYVAAGASVALEWFVAGLQPDEVVRYSGSCTHVEYDNPPV